MACSSGEPHAICFLWAHVFYVLILPFLSKLFESMNTVIKTICPSLTKFFG